jgi:hypothetical protein
MMDKFLFLAHVHHMIEKVTTGGLEVKTACRNQAQTLRFVFNPRFIMII